MRLLIAFATVLCLVATQAEAKSVVRLDYKGGSSVRPDQTGGRGIAANPSDLLSFDIVVDLGYRGIGEINFDLTWMNSDDIVLHSAFFETGIQRIPNRPRTLGELLSPSRVVQDGVGTISNIGWSAVDFPRPPRGDHDWNHDWDYDSGSDGLGFSSGRHFSQNYRKPHHRYRYHRPKHPPHPGPRGEVFLGSVIFHVAGGERSELWLGFFGPDSGGTTPRGKSIRPAFGHFVVETVSVPEPGVASLMLLGLLGLFAAGRHARHTQP